MDLFVLTTSGGALFLGIFIAFLLFSQSGQDTPARRILGVLVLLGSLNASHPVMMGLLFPTITGGIRLMEPMQFLMAPLIVAYLQSLMNGALRLRLSMLWHLLPFALALSFALLVMRQGISEAGQGIPVISLVFWFCLLIQALAYLVPAFQRIHVYSRKLQDQVSNLQGLDLSWLRWFLGFILALCAGYAAVIVLLIHSPDLSFLHYCLSLAMTVLVWGLGCRGLLQKPRVGEPDVKLQKYEKNQLPDSDFAEAKASLVALMQQRKPYLQPELSLSDLADSLGLTRNRLSMVINSGFGQNFHDFINSWRVREFARLCLDPAKRGEKLLTLAFDAGFNSKPAFNAVFRKLAGMTPSQFRNNPETGLILPNETI